jgi:hypothetical protein
MPYIYMSPSHALQDNTLFVLELSELKYNYKDRAPLRRVQFLSP